MPEGTESLMTEQDLTALIEKVATATVGPAMEKALEPLSKAQGEYFQGMMEDRKKAEDEKAGDCVERLYEGRDRLNLYGKALLSLTLSNLGDAERARLVLRNIMQYVEENPETGIAWFRTPRQGWWYWWNSDIETNAWCLRALVRLEPKSEVAPRLVKWLLENRRNGYYWRSTRDTTLCVAAMSEFVLASGEGRPDYTLTLNLDGGAVVKQVKISKDNSFTYDNTFLVEGVALEGGLTPAKPRLPPTLLSRALMVG